MKSHPHSHGMLIPIVRDGGISVGDVVRIKRGICGEGYRFTVAKILPGHFGETQVYGTSNYGPVRLSEVEVCS